MELSKREKKVAREVIEKGLQKEFDKGLSGSDKILNEWKSKQIDNRDAYLKLFSHISDFDKHIGRRYDSMSGSKYLPIITGQLLDGIISENDLEGFSEEVQQSIKSYVESLKDLK